MYAAKCLTVGAAEFREQILLGWARCERSRAVRAGSCPSVQLQQWYSASVAVLRQRPVSGYCIACTYVVVDTIAAFSTADWKAVRSAVASEEAVSPQAHLGKSQNGPSTCRACG